MKAVAITPGMTIVNENSVKVGTVREIWAETEAHGCLPVSRHLLQDYGPIKGNAKLFNIEQGFLQVRKTNSGGTRNRDLWIPLHALVELDIQTVGELQITAGSFETDFVERPARLQNAA